MASSLSHRLLDRIHDAQGLYHRLVLAVGPARTGKTGALKELSEAMGWPRINVNLALAERLLDLTQKQRAIRVASLLNDIVKAASSDVVLLDNTEMLFAVDLAQDPLRLLQGLSRNCTIVASWSGRFDGNSLTYAEPGHSEFRKYAAPQAVVVSTAEAPTSDVATAPEENR